MRTMSMISIVAACLAAAACNKAPDKPKTPDEVKDAVSKLAKPEPGKYRTTMKVIDVRIPGMDAARAEKMKEMFGSTGRSFDFCLSKEDADKGFEELNKRTTQGNCTYDRFDAGNGTLDAKVTCQTGKGMTTTSEMHGTYSPTGSKMTMKSDTNAPGMPGQGMHIEAEVTNERLGECT
ncbi:MAG: DUF3617 domain-containing protein [Sphingomonadales bacterium]|nr:DUF3617 domain-containing protein [Sphingomonadales bacterium]